MITTLFLLMQLIQPSMAQADVAVATYSVPVTEDLASVATFNLTDFSLQAASDGTSTVSFQLPPELTGSVVKKIDLSGALPQSEGASTAMSGFLASANCVQHSGQDNCTLNYNASYLNAPLPEVTDYLTKTFAASPDLQARLAVAGRFSNDPAGVVSFPAGL
jgi:hypothetical protein